MKMLRKLSLVAAACLLVALAGSLAVLTLVTTVYQYLKTCRLMSQTNCRSNLIDVLAAGLLRPALE